MKQLIGVAMLAAYATACSSAQPYKINSPAPTNAPDAIYSCALSLANSLGYTVEQANKDSGFFKAERSERKGASSIHWGATLNEELTVLVLSVPGAPPSLQVTAASNYSTGRNLRLIEPTTQSRSEADQILATCAK